MQLKLGHHQKTILQILDRWAQDGLLESSVTMLSWEAARRLEKEYGSYIVPSLRKKGYTLTPRWRATFSRSLKRLEDRGLIKRINYYPRGRTHRVCLTPEGREIGESEVKVEDV